MTRDPRASNMSPSTRLTPPHTERAPKVNLAEQRPPQAAGAAAFAQIQSRSWVIHPCQRAAVLLRVSVRGAYGQVLPDFTGSGID